LRLDRFALEASGHGQAATSDRSIAGAYHREP
jgi:hypothetical protein